MDQMSKMHTDEFEDFFFNVCNLDYSKMSKSMDSLKELMNKTDNKNILIICTILLILNILSN